MNLKTIAAVLGFSLALFAGGQAMAQDQKQALAREAVQLMDADETVRVMFDAMSPLMAAGMGREMGLSASETARLGELLAEEFRGSNTEFVNRLADVYATRMSEEQLREVVRFLRSPAGAAWIETQSSAERQLEAIGQELGMQVALRAVTRLNAERAR